MVDLTKIGDRLKMFRQNEGLTLRKLAEETGVHWMTLSNAENNHSIPNLFNLLILAEYYGVTVSELIGEEDKE